MDPYDPVSPLPPGLDLGEWEDVSEPAQLDLVTLRSSEEAPGCGRGPSRSSPAGTRVVHLDCRS